jgi:hypothetical protein
MGARDLTVHMEGHPGHRGNVLAHAFVRKLQRLLSALAQAERMYNERGRRQTDYEISEASKTNPTQVTLHPVPRQRNYDPLPAFRWTYEQLERIAAGGPIDERIDSTLAETLADIADRGREDEYTRFWISGNGTTVIFDEQFKARCRVVVAHRREIERAPRWFQGVSYGSIVGELKLVGDIEGERQFVIVPPAGVDRIECTFPESQRENMRNYLWQTVRVSGRLTYKETSPFPTHIDMDHIERVPVEETAPHLLELRGLFKGLDRDEYSVEQLLNGL